MSGVVVVSCLKDTGSPLALLPVQLGYDTLEEGIEAAREHYRRNFGQGVEPQFRVYQDRNGHALVEVFDGGGEMVITGLYKVIAGRSQSSGGKATKRK